MKISSHLLALVCLLGMASAAQTQDYQSAQWYTRSGGLETGIVWFDKLRLESAAQYGYGTVQQQGAGTMFLQSPHRDLQWLAVNGDTLLRSIEYQGRPILLQAWNQDSLRLYSTIAPNSEYQFFWTTDGTDWKALDSLTIEQTALALVPDGCRYFSDTYQHGKWSANYLLYLTRATSRCLSDKNGSESKTECRMGLTYFWRALVVNKPVTSNATPIINFGFSGQYLWRVSRGQGVGLGLQTRYLRFEGGSEASSRFSINQLYTDLGVAWEPLTLRLLSPFAEAGPTLVIPVSFKAPRAANSRLQDDPSMSVGLYYTLGIRAVVSEKWLFSLQRRSVFVSQDWPTPAASSSLDKLGLWQVSLLYALKPTK